MTHKETKISLESFPMKGGDGPYSYARNSSCQRGGLECAKAIIDKAIAEKLDIKQLISSSSSTLKPFKIADLGCSIGPNTFNVVQNIIEAINLKYQSHGLSSHPLEFQVFFNDLASNDFNTLFISLPPDRRYFTVGVPGSFHGRLFPRSSLHFVHSSYTLHWLSRVPKEVVDKNSPAWNKGKIHYTSASKEVVEAYSAQFAMDMESFLQARAQELVCGGLMALLIPCLPNDISHSDSSLTPIFSLLGSSLMDMAKMGMFSEDKVDSFNIPVYNPSMHEVENVIERNGCFSIERMEPLTRLVKHVPAPDPKTFAMHLRAPFEGIITSHFGSEIIDDLFDSYAKKIEDSHLLFNPGNFKTIELFVLLKRR